MATVLTIISREEDTQYVVYGVYQNVDMANPGSDSASGMPGCSQL